MTITTDVGFQQTVFVESGQRFDRLVVLDADRRVQSGKARPRGVLVRCDCGTVKEVVLGSLLRGSTRSCGCLNAEVRSRPKPERRKHIIQLGDKFGSLVVIAEVASDKHGRRFQARCACGTAIEVSVANLVSGNTATCGCSRVVWDRSDPEWEWRRYLWLAYRITPEQYREMLERQGGGCGVCGKPPGKRRLHVDHDHSCCPVTSTRKGTTWNRSCGKCVRGLLCFSCNSKVGWLEAFWGPLAAYLGRGMN